MTGRVASDNGDKYHCQKYGERTRAPPKKQTRRTAFPYGVSGNPLQFAENCKQGRLDAIQVRLVIMSQFVLN